MSAKPKIGVLGASGYTGAELVRLLLRHPHVEIALLTADRRAGKPMAQTQACEDHGDREVDPRRVERRVAALDRPAAQVSLDVRQAGVVREDQARSSSQTETARRTGSHGFTAMPELLDQMFAWRPAR